jgi:hypothetical protein
MRCKSIIVTLAIALLAATAPHLVQAATTREIVQALLPKLGQANAPGDVLFKEDFSGNLDRWTHGNDWTIVDKPDGGGKCVSVTSIEADHVNMVLNAHIPVVPGHAIAVYWKTRLVSGTAPPYLRVDFFGEDGKQGQPYAHQEPSQTGPQWTENAMLVSDWFPAYTRAITIWFHHEPKAHTTSLISDIKVVDLSGAVLAVARQELARYEDLGRNLPAQAAALPQNPVADSWRPLITRYADRMRAEVADAAKLEPGSAELQKAIERPATYLARLSEAIDGLKRGSVKTRRLLTYSTTPVTSQMVLPYSPDLPGAALGGLQLAACPGETRPGSLVLWGPEAVSGVMPRVSDLKGPGGTIPASAVDVKWVKCWYKAGSAPYGVAQDRSHKVLVAELLLNDDGLLKVDLEGQHNSLKLAFPEGARYVPIDDPTPPKPAWGFAYKLADFPVRDAAALQPTDLPAGQNKQVWISVRVPASARPGRYQGKIALTAGTQALGDVSLTLEVLPFALVPPRTHYDLTQDFTGSLYYWGQLDPTGAGSISYNMKSEEQFRAELKMMYDHNIIAPTVIWSPNIVYKDEPFFRKHLAIAKKIGLAGKPLYFGDSGMIGAPTDPAALETLKENVRKTIRIAAEYGFTGVYFYGIDEATGDTLKSERVAWQAVHEAGGKVIVSGFQGQLQAVGDVLDLFNRCADPAGEPAVEWHNRGHKIWNYGHPQTPIEDPAVYRRNYGLYLWRLDYDGTNTYCFMDSSGTQWNDFDDDTYRDHCLAYPTTNGVVGTLAIEGFRMGIDDVKYATVLRLLIDKASREGSATQKAKAAKALEWLDGIDTRSADLDEVRHGMVQRIEELRK